MLTRHQVAAQGQFIEGAKAALRRVKADVIDDDVAKLADVARNAISKMVAGERGMSVHEAAAICRGVGAPLVFGDVEIAPREKSAGASLTAACRSVRKSVVRVLGMVTEAEDEDGEGGTEITDREAAEMLPELRRHRADLDALIARLEARGGHLRTA